MAKTQPTLSWQASRVTRDAIASLMAQTDKPRVSVYLPTHHTSPDCDQDPIRFKSLLKRAEQMLEQQGARAQWIRNALEPGLALQRDDEFWRHQGAGLAAFISEEGLEVFRLPVAVEELVVVADHYHLKPLLQVLASDARFHVLAISQHAVRLFEATRDTMRALDLIDIPRDLRDTVGYDWEQRSLQFHTGTGGAKGQSGMRGGMFHGHGAPRDDEKAEIAQYLREVDEGVVKLVGEEGVPVVLAAVGYIASMYKKLSDHPNVVEQTIDGNPDEMAASDLHRDAWKLVQPIVAEERRGAVARYHEAVGGNRATNDLQHVLGAALDGRIDTIFVTLGEQCWGTFDAQLRVVTKHAAQQPGDRDLLDLAAVQSFVTRAAVYAVPRDEVPDEGMVAAILRY